MPGLLRAVRDHPLHLHAVRQRAVRPLYRLRFLRPHHDEARFVLTFLKCRGSIKEVEKELGISYPTVKSRLEAVISRLGLTATPSSEELKEQRLQTLDRLSRGEITPDQAAEILKNLNL